MENNTKLVILFTDVNECLHGTDNCDLNAKCTDTIGSFECTCNQGFIGDGQTCSGKEFNLNVLSSKV